jgi:hypothetical protein
MAALEEQRAALLASMTWRGALTAPFPPIRRAA